MQIKYDNHAQEFRQVIADADKQRVAETWFLEDRVDSWRHERMHDHVLPLLRQHPGGSWLTVGDGRFGTDAHYLLARGAAKVVASDFSDELLRIGAQRGYIGEYSAQNAEAMSYGDNAFDFIYCKESYHHFPRPPIALYEMLRVARIGVVLTEPQDRGEVALTIARIVKRLRGRPFNRHNFETVGNYIYTVDRLEIEKLMLAVGLQHYAYRGINDFYIPGVEEVPLTGGGARDRWKRFLVHFGISVQDFGCRAGICRAGLVTLAIFKRPPEAALVEAATAAGFHFVELPKNPYR